MIRFDHVSKVYKRGARPALDDVDIKVNRDEFVFLVGASGSGKSTFLRLVLREERPTKGRIHVLRRDRAADVCTPAHIQFFFPHLSLPSRSGEKFTEIGRNWRILLTEADILSTRVSISGINS